MESVAIDMSHPPPESDLLRVIAKHTAAEKNEMPVDTQYMLLFQVWHACYTCYYYYYYDYSFMNDHLAHSLYSLLARSVDICVVVDEFCWVDPSASPCTAPASSRQESLGNVISNPTVSLSLFHANKKKQCAMYYNIQVRY